MPVKDNRVAGVVSACVARGIIKRRRQIIYNLAFAFIAPLRPDDNDSFGSGFLRHDRSYSFARPHLATPVPNLSALQVGPYERQRPTILRCAEVQTQAQCWARQARESGPAHHSPNA